MDSKIIDLIDILTYKRYEIPNRKDSYDYVFPVITPIKFCKKSKIKLNKTFLKQKMFPLLKKTDYKNYSFEEMKDIMVVLTQGIIKYEINSPYKIHRAVPSARGINPCEIYIFSENKIERYNPLHNCYDVLADTLKKETSDEFTIIIAADDWRLGKFYGDFSYILSALDAGHIIGQLNILSFKLGCDLEITYSGFNTMNINNYSKFFYNQGLIIFASILVKKQKKLKKYNTYFNYEFLREKNYLENISELTYRNELVDLKRHLKYINYDRKIENIEKEYLFKYENLNLSLKYIFKNRTSAHNKIGLMSLGKIYKIKDKLKWIKNEIHEYISHTNISEYINIYIYLNNNEKTGNEYMDGYYYYDYLNKNLILKKRKLNRYEEWYRIIHDSHEYLNVESIPIVFIISVNLKKIIEKYDVRSIDVSYIISGEISQIISILATRYKWFCRPIKNICENKLEEILEIDTTKERITYALLVGKPNIIQETFYFNLI